ncbi:bifunctional copper resistance protein CopD/cytochrome c oxidase assembly protein [Actinoplanes sp. TRM 88003]|uniref:Bifunctional copper resistance protein CopD/cytochrome c oxidase assembly protein n=1 Tax=Paractinoplanes aksuensis TaxID=2939490 RepID=A0ABT1E149_9ACTN|nr:cytochrome c oxidase assembly protein [Actinoplanes aksuensis]MCO8276757.1 bifunctional copper resistance protein CopD/cytochrome c oxidase assembly protein [Actinoplanes aksuensis]
MRRSLISAGAAAVVALVAALRFGGAVDGTVLPGIPSPGPVTEWALPVLTMVATVLGVLTVGLTATAAFLLPGDGRSVAAHGWVLLRRTTWLALLWAATSAALVVFTVSDVLGLPVERLGRSSIVSFAFSVSQGQSLMWQVGLALAVAIASRAGLSRGTAAVTAGLALAAVLPPTFTGHSAGAGNHQLAVSSLALHVLAASLWVGGLAGLLLVRRHRRFAETAARYSRLALACFAATAISGLVNAGVRLGDWPALWSSRYGALVLLKVLALLAVGAIGAAHRARTLPALRSGTPWAFVRLAAGELIVLSAAVGLSVALSRSPTPVPETAVEPDPLVELLGFDQPGPPTAVRMLADPLPDMFFLTVVAAGILAYLAGVRRMRRAGHPWPVSRTASWIGGLLLLGAITGLGVARYAYVLFSAHMVQHMVLSMVVPILLVGGAPVTLALRTLRRPADPQVRGAREWLLLILHSRVMRLLSHPLVALGIYVASLYGLYMGGLLGTLMRYHLGHLAMLVHFVLAGYLLFWVLIGIDPGRRRVHPALLVIVHFLAMVAHAFFGFVLLQSTTVIADDWYTAAHPPWAASPLDDQHLGAGLAWAFGELPAAAILLLLVRQWIRSDEREQSRLDRAADRAEATGEEDDLSRYNAFLAAADADSGADRR